MSLAALLLILGGDKIYCNLMFYSESYEKYVTVAESGFDSNDSSCIDQIGLGNAISVFMVWWYVPVLKSALC